jgi:hypothetical protein
MNISAALAALLTLRAWTGSQGYPKCSERKEAALIRSVAKGPRAVASM